MKCKYSFLEVNESISKTYSGTVEDFKNILHEISDHARASVIELENGQVWIFYRKFGRIVWELALDPNKKRADKPQQLTLNFGEMPPVSNGVNGAVENASVEKAEG